MVWGFVALLALLPVFGLAVLSWSSKRPATLGVTAGRLAPCPATPNCVSSQSTDDEHRVEPFSISGADENIDRSQRAKEQFTRLAAVIGEFRGVKIVRQTDDYLHAEFTSRLFRFVDDLEVYLVPAAGVIHCRSASRVGKSDLGANRQRIEAIRKVWSES